MQFIPEGAYVRPAPRRRVVAGLVAALGVVIALSALVGCLATDEGFDWDLASVFGTALGTTLLALGTFWLAMSTYQDVRASQQLAALSAEQLELGRETNHLMRSEQRERLQPSIIAAESGGATSGGSNNTLNVDLINVGGGPAVRIDVTARYMDAGKPFKDDPAVAAVSTDTIPFLASGDRELVKLSFNLAGGTGPPGGIDFRRFRIKGRYLDRHGIYAGDIFDWKHEEPEQDSDES
jgi:hypothetical protein